MEPEAITTDGLDEDIQRAIDIIDNTNTPEAPVFRLQQNTQAQEIRQLNDTYPREARNIELGYPATDIFSGRRRTINSLIRTVRNAQMVRSALNNIDEVHKTRLQNHFEGIFSSEIVDAATHPTMKLEESHLYSRVRSEIRAFRTDLSHFISRKRRFGALHAEWRQKAALIRQRPRTYVTINSQEILEAICNWENIWGVSIKINEDDNLDIRIGLCNITMTESAETSRFNYQPEILLAPFTFSLTLTESGNFFCLSTDVYGHTYNDELLDWYVHPHQLSDQPCFGSFSQSMQEMAAKGDVIALISTIIAFYSQYNSDDSAGVDARSFHPTNLDTIRDTDTYKTSLHATITNHSEFYTTDYDKLMAAIEDYCAWHEETRNNEECPRITIDKFCYCCEQTQVNDNNEYSITHEGDRVCTSCWYDYYCEACARHSEDCVCEPQNEN